MMVMSNFITSTRNAISSIGQGFANIGGAIANSASWAIQLPGPALQAVSVGLQAAGAWIANVVLLTLEYIAVALAILTVAVCVGALLHLIAMRTLSYNGRGPRRRYPHARDLLPRSERATNGLSGTFFDCQHAQLRQESSRHVQSAVSTTSLSAYGAGSPPAHGGSSPSVRTARTCSTMAAYSPPPAYGSFPGTDPRE